jgi:hypothetical protein
LGQQGFELIELLFDGIVARKAGGAFELAVNG